MGFLKNMAINSVTKKHFNKLIRLIENEQPFDPMRTIKNCYKSVGLETHEITDFMDFPREPGQQKTWEELFIHLVRVLTLNELSYDPTISRSGEDLDFITKSCNKQLAKWKRESTLKKFIRREKYEVKKL